MDEYKWVVPPAFLETIIREKGEHYAKGMVAYTSKAEIESQEIIERLNKRFNS